MKNFKRAIKLLFLMSLIILASLGIGLSGGVPIPLTKKRNTTPTVKVELVESKEEAVNTAEKEAKF